ncbi:hypothetical protein [Cupriavidus campinensis]
MQNEEMVESVTPTSPETVEQVQEAGNKSSEEAAEQPSGQVEEQEEPKREPWFQKRINKVTWEREEAVRRAERAEQRIREYEARTGSESQHGEQPQGQPQDVQTLARQEAQRMRAEERFNEACNKVYEAGASEFKDFDSAVKNLQMVGANRDFLELATSSDAGHKVLHHLGTDLDEAARILSLPPVQMARELTKLEIKLSQPAAPKPVSKAPAPITPLGSGKATGDGLSDDLPIEEWMRRNNAGRRR